MFLRIIFVYEIFEELRLLVDCIEPLHLNEEELALIKGSFSMLAASTTIAQFTSVRSDVEGERAASGPQFLGKDIQLLFTPQEHVQRVDAYLKSKNEQIAQKMHVRSIDAAHVLAGMS